MKDWGQVAGGDGRAAVGAGRTAGTRGWTVSSMGRDSRFYPPGTLKEEPGTAALGTVCSVHP